MHRALAAACSGLLTTFLFYPLESVSISRQLNMKNCIKNPYAGVINDMCGKFISTGVYFYTYEYVKANMFTDTSFPKLSSLSPAVSSSIAISTSSLIQCPTKYRSLKIQNKKNFKVAAKVPLNKFTLVKFYGLHVFKNVPRAAIKYTIYELCKVSLSSFYDKSIIGFLAGCVSSIVTTFLLYPFDYIRTQLTFGTNHNVLDQIKKKGIMFLYGGVFFNLIKSMLSNGIGHALLEKWSD